MSRREVSQHRAMKTALRNMISVASYHYNLCYGESDCYSCELIEAAAKELREADERDSL